MFISSAHAQAAAGGGGENFLVSLLPLLLIFVIFWFFLIRPQQRKAKEHREMVQALKRGDQVLTAGGIIGRVTKVLDESTVQVEIAENVRVRVARETVSQVMSKSAQTKAARPAEEKAAPEEKAQEPESAEPATPPPSGESSGRKSMFSFGSKK